MMEGPDDDGGAELRILADKGAKQLEAHAEDAENKRQNDRQENFHADNQGIPNGSP